MFKRTKAQVKGNALIAARQRMGSFLRGLFLTRPAERHRSLASLRKSVEESSLIPEIVWVRLVTDREYRERSS
jgi:hypothetical protein